MSGNTDSILENLKQHAIAAPDRTILAVDDEQLTYGQLFDEIAILVAGLRFYGIQPGDRVALIFPNSLTWYTLYWAIVALGACPVPLDPQIGIWELRQFFQFSGVQLCCCTARYRGNRLLHNLVAITDEYRLSLRIVSDGEPFGDERCITLGQLRSKGTSYSAFPIHLPEYDATLMFAFTSGTTGDPKMIEVGHGGFCRAMRDMAGYLELTSDDSMLCGMPLYHQGGFGMGLQVVLCGGTAWYMHRFDPVQFCNIVRQRRISVLQLTPTLANILLTSKMCSPETFQSVRIVYFAGEVLPDRIAQMFCVVFGKRVVNIVGSSETGTMIVWDSQYDTGADVNSFRPLPFTAVKLINEQGGAVPPGTTGIIAVTTDAVMKGYFGNPCATARVLSSENGKRWFVTGDLGCMLSDGRIQFVGRAKRIIKRGANLVYPEEIETFLLACEGVAAVAVLGEKHAILGEAIVAHVQPEKNHVLTRNDVFKMCRTQLSSYKVPDQIVFAETIPIATGKVQYKFLRKKGVHQ